MQREQRRHRGERGADEDGAAVAAPGADDRQRNCCDCCDRCSQADRGEVELAGELNLLLGEEVHRRQRDSRQRSSGDEEGHDLLGSAAGRITRTVGTVGGPLIPQTGASSAPKEELVHGADLGEAELVVEVPRPILVVGQQEGDVVSGFARLLERLRNDRAG